MNTARLLLFVILITGFLASTNCASANDMTFTDVTGSQRGESGNVAIASLKRDNWPKPLQHDYSPTVMRDTDGKLKVWWCGQEFNSFEDPGNEGIWYSESNQFGSGWGPGWLPTNWPPANEAVDTEEDELDGGFDNGYACDPSVIRHEGYYYLYYTGINAAGANISQVGVLRSYSGVKGTWEYPPAIGDAPIVSPFRDDVMAGLPDGWYGAGTPSVVKVNDWFYLYYQDDTHCPDEPFEKCTAPAAKGYILRSKEPWFPLNNREELREDLDAQNNLVIDFFPDDINKQYPIWVSTNASLLHHPGLRSFMLANTGATGDQLAVVFFNDDFSPAATPILPYFPLATGLTMTTGYWTEGPGLLRNSQGKALFEPVNYLQSDCDIGLDFMRSVGTKGQENSPTWDLSWVGITKNTQVPCGDVLPKVLMDYDGDRWGDPALYRTSTPGYWTRSTSTGQAIHQFGTSASFPVLGDFDGDGVSDRAVITPGGSIAGYYDWTWISSSDGVERTITTWGLQGDDVAIADYDGDGKDDFAVWRPSDATWYVLYSAYPSNPSVSFSQAWGVAGDRAVPEDYDGDGKADLSIYRPSDGKWYIWKSSGGSQIVTFGDQYCRPVPGDYDGDGKADWGCWRWKNRKYYILLSDSLVVETSELGERGDKLVVADFSGDGRLDFVTWRPSDGIWRIEIRGTSGEQMSKQWGGLVDDLVPKRIENHF